MTPSAEASVLLLSGQGAHKPYMGASSIALPLVRETCELASEVFGFDVIRLVSIASEDQINDPICAQAATAALSIGLARELLEQGFAPRALIGFSLGEISALAVAESLSLSDTFTLIKVRAEMAARAVKMRPGVMSALLRGSVEEVSVLCETEQQDEIVVPANLNCPGQTVISGDLSAVERVETAWHARGGRVLRLATAGAFHSPLMVEAAKELQSYCESITFAEPRIPIICNTDARPFRADEAAIRLAHHLTHPVLFEKSVRTCIEGGVRCFIEAGFGGVLVGLVKRIDTSVERVCIDSSEALHSWNMAQVANLER